MTRLNIPLFVALAASLLAASDARTNTLPHQRMIRKRTPGSFAVLPRWENFQERADLIPGLGNGSDPSDSASSSAAASRTTAAAGTTTASSSKAAATTSDQSTTSTAASSTAVASSSTQTTQSATSSSGGLLDSLTGLLGGTQTSTTVSSTSTTTTSSSVASTTSTTPATSAAPTTTQPAATTPSPTLNLATTPAPSSAAASQSVTVVTSIAPEAVASQQAEQKARTAKITKNTIISLVVIASCIGGAVAIWTVIRKWKLSPSERFDDRMQPIDWAPTGGAGGMREETLEEKQRHRRAGSAGSHGSFTSGGVGQSELGHGTGARSVYSDHTGHNVQQAQDFPPAHDFTAGTGNYGQYHQGQQQQYGYADLQRGPSVTESSYSHGASVTRGLSYSRGGNGGYEAQPGAGDVPPMPNPYGGGYEYEDYGRQQPQVPAQGQYRGY